MATSKSATDYLEEYGFRNMAPAESPAAYIRLIGASQTADLTTERWVATEGGFLCFKADPSWGKPSEVDGLYQVPWRLTDEFSEAAGLTPARNPAAFVWVWPAAVVAHMYRYAHEGWHKKLDADGLTIVDDDGLAVMELDDGFHLKAGRAERIEA